MSFSYILRYLQKYWFYITIFIVLIIIIIIYVIFYHNNLTNEDLIEEITIDKNIELIKEETVVDTTKYIKVDIKGAVNNPGVYELQENSRVSDALNLSGGLRDDADTSIINLSKLLKDEMVIIIYTKEEIESMRNGNTSIKYIEKECICPSINNDACIDDNKITNNDNTNTSSNSNNADNKEIAYPISINTASVEQLTNLPGIGETKAKAIVEYRNQNGNFKTIEEITNVSGIGNSTFEKIKAYITI